MKTGNRRAAQRTESPVKPRTRKRERKPEHAAAAGGASKLGLLLVVVAAAFAFLPLAELLDTGVRAPDFDVALRTWLVGTAATLVVALAAARALAAVPLVSWRKRRLVDLFDRRTLLLAAILVGGAFVLYAVVSCAVFDGLPLYVDEMAQARQANIFLSGRLWLPTPQPAEFFSSFLMVDFNGKTFSQFPPGWSLLLAIGELINARWLMGPLFGAAAVAGVFLLARALGEMRGFAVGAAALLALSPWFALNSGSQMNHTATVALLVLGSAALISAVNGAERRLLLAAVAGFSFAFAAAMRPLNAAAFTVPAFFWLAGRAVQARRIKELVLFSLGAAIPIALLLGFNAVTTGDPLRFGYVAQWGAGHGLGFHDSPWGPPHTFARGVASINAYLRGIQAVMFESPMPALLPPLIALALTPAFSAADRFLLTASAFLVTGYLLYWYSADLSGDYLGPRYLLPLAPILVIWTMRLPRAVAARTSAPIMRAAAPVCIVLMVVSGAPGALSRMDHYAHIYPARRIDADALVGEQGISNSLILVPSSWLDQLSPRVWALGITRPASEGVTSDADLCLLEQAVSELARHHLRGEEALARLEPLKQSRRASAAQQLPLLCRARAVSETRGTWSLQPFQLARKHNNVFARDLNAATEALLSAYPDRRVYVARPDSERGLERPVFVPFKLDSVRDVWWRTGDVR